MNKTLMVLALAVALLVPLSASADGRGHIVVGVRPFVYGGFGPYFGPHWGPYWGGYWDSYYPANPYWTMGEVKLDTKLKDAEIFVNGSYLGTTGDNKSFFLPPGGYKLEVRAAGRAPFAVNVYVTVGHTVRLKPGF